MSFVDGFYTFSVSLSNIDRGIYQRFRIKTAKHPYESLSHLFTRMLAFTHAYEEGLEFSQGLYEPKEPAAWKKDVLGELLLWLEVGAPEKKKLQRTLREHNGDVRHLIYFFEPDDIESFCHDCLRGSSSNWVAPIEFYEIPPAFVTEASGLLDTRSSWEATIVDSLLYLVMDGVEFQTSIAPVDIWERYQAAIGNA